MQYLNENMPMVAFGNKSHGYTSVREISINVNLEVENIFSQNINIINIKFGKHLVEHELIKSSFGKFPLEIGILISNLTNF